MTKFDERVTKNEEARAKERLARINAELMQRLQDKTREEAFASLMESLVFIGGVSNVLPAVKVGV